MSTHSPKPPQRRRPSADQDDGSPSRLPRLLGAIAVLGLAYLLFWMLRGGPTGSTVAGQVSLDGQPLGLAQVIFVPEDEQHSSPRVTQADERGYYQLAGPNGSGLPVGKYKVVVTKMAVRGPAGPALKGEGLLEAREQGLVENILPQVYEDRSTTPLQFELHPGANTCNLELKKQP